MPNLHDARALYFGFGLLAPRHVSDEAGTVVGSFEEISGRRRPPADRGAVQARLRVHDADGVLAWEVVRYDDRIAPPGTFRVLGGDDDLTIAAYGIGLVDGEPVARVDEHGVVSDAARADTTLATIRMTGLWRTGSLVRFQTTMPHDLRLVVASFGYSWWRRSEERDRFV